MMKALAATAAEIVKNPTFIKITAIAIASFTLFVLANHYSASYSPFSSSTSTATATTSLASPAPESSPPTPPASPPPPPPPSPPPPPPPEVERMGIVDENGAMSEEFKVGEFDATLAEELKNASGGVKDGSGGDGNGGGVRVKIDKFGVCDQKFTDYIPCLDNVDEIKKLNSTERGEKFERHCPGEGKRLNCLVPRPKGYQIRIPWPQSRDEVWFSNVPHTRLVEDKGGQNWIAIKKDKFVFPGGGTQFIHGANEYLDQISQMIPEIAFGRKTRVALDVGCGVASFGAFLMQRNVTTLSVAPKDVHENQIQFALERGVPAMVAVFATHRLLYPSQAFDLIHCSRCRINWTRDDGIWLLEVDRLLRAGGYFVWAAQPVYKHEEALQVQWKEMEDLTTRICWELIKKEGMIAIWRKPLNNSCYLSRDVEVQPPLCDSNDDPDNVWYVGLKACITRLPENGYGANVSLWPARLQDPPDRLQSIRLDAYISRKEIFTAEAKYWNEILTGYVGAYHWKELNFRNIMDMRAGYGGFAAALHDHGLDCWVMNVVPVSGFNTLPVIYDRGLIGVMHDWCEPFDTYPRTYDLLHAAGLFSIEQKRCNISTIILEMDRMLRPGGRVYIRDSVSVIGELHELANAVGWVPALHDTGEGPHASWKILMGDKRL
ncbi:putative S-adenosyl-L-methionine-dependent methyltransferase [Rosa chinensis]|uniref:Methyltransferase n=1 Tax=Rosa chinensis TaxID=74649 RepID=A0A2P6PXK0_ROSCH|nr:probable methyltransferase PMT10 [Rosa chinensis]PRQ26649.1 putative S-adenosyl-L-methionine-dependent methyltransferase [Rosa chinensis]